MGERKGKGFVAVAGVVTYLTTFQLIDNIMGNSWRQGYGSWLARRNNRTVDRLTT